MTPEQTKRLGQLLAMGMPLPIALPLAIDPKQSLRIAADTAAMVDNTLETGKDIAADLVTGKTKRAKRKVKSAAKTAYSKAFKKVQGKYKTKAGKWKKDGFKRAVREAHKIAKRSRK